MTRWRARIDAIRLTPAAAIAGVLGCLVYGNAILNGFAFDDVHILLENESIQTLARFSEVLTSPYWPNEFGSELGLWRPVASGIYALGWAVWGENAAAFHLVNVLVHGLVSGLVVLLLGRFLPAGAALLGGVIFALHPVHVEAVANIVGFAELFATLMFLLACLVYVRPRKRIGLGTVFGITTLYTLGFLTKEMVVTLPAALFLLDALDRDRSLADLSAYVAERLTLWVALVGVTAIMLVIRMRVLGSVADPLPPLGADILQEIPRIWTVAGIWPHYVRLMFFPFDLIADYSPGVIEIYHQWNIVNLLGLALGFGFLTLAWTCWRVAGRSAGADSLKAVTIGVLWFVVTVSPVSNFFFLAGTLLGERTLYLPSVGLALGAGWVLWHALEARPRTALSVLLIALVSFSLRAWTRTPTWDSTQSVFQALINQHPESGRAQWVTGDTFFTQNDVSRALHMYRVAIGTVGTGYGMISEINRRVLGIKRWEQGEALARWAWNDRPEYALAPGLLAIALTEQGKFEEAIEAGEASLRLEPGDPLVSHVLARAYDGAGRYREAIHARRTAIKNGEGQHWQQWTWLGELQVKNADTMAALMSLDSARLRTMEDPALQQIDSLLVAWTSGKKSP
jgi:tetratricopeptide (TPR) repeat protein